MPRKSKNKFDINGDTISIMRDGWQQMAFATYRDDYYEELSSHTWSLSNGYPSDTTLGGGLHRYMMAKWYSADVLRDLTAKGYVVDHMNNDPMDCRICNLEFLKHNRNVAKGQYLDKEAKQMRLKLAVSLFKDFSTGCYQITIGCNDHIVTQDSSGRQCHINSIKLLYNCDYSLVVLDAEAILTQYEAVGKFSISQLHCCDSRVQEAAHITLTDAEKKQGFVIRDGVYYLVIGNGKTFLSSIRYEEGWLLPEN
ncbi:MAG: HNH endonuclease [Peptococcaceae bacterium]|nr:HNH endonuclease [Peptococcaceae bacterium]